MSELNEEILPCQFQAPQRSRVKSIKTSLVVNGAAREVVRHSPAQIPLIPQRSLDVIRGQLLLISRMPSKQRPKLNPAGLPFLRPDAARFFCVQACC